MALRQLWIISLVAVCVLADDDATVTLQQGTLRGKHIVFLGQKLEVYLGIPYAEPPVGNLRFKKPVPARPWNSVLDATEIKPGCMQGKIPGFGSVKGTSEDCLFVNVWSPGKGETLKTVMVWIHGGGFNFGSSYEDWYNGTVLAATADVVVVTLNYRLGLFGFLTARTTAAPGNMGLYDQALALQWVQENIEAFGGNPEKVTLFGESAGSMSVHAHIISPLSQRLFHRAIMMSGNLYAGLMEGADEMVRRSNNFARHVGCATLREDFSTQSDDVLQCLRSRPAEELQAEYDHFELRFIKKMMPIFNDEFVPVAPCLAITSGLLKNVDVMSGVTKDEGAFAFILQPDKRIAEEDLQHVGEEELENVLRSVMQDWLHEVSATLWKHYEKDINPSTWKTDFRKASSNYITDIMFKCPNKLFSDRLLNAGPKLFSYVFGHRSDVSHFPKWAGAPHTSDIFYVFGLPLLYPEQYTEDDRQLSRDFMKMASTFAKEGVPMLPTEEKWPEYTAEDPLSIYMKAGNFTPVKPADLDICDLWQEHVC